MNLMDLRNAIIGNKIPNLLILTGPEVGVQDTYLNQISAAKSAKIQAFETLADLWHTRINSRLITGNLVQMVRGDESVLKDEEAWKCLRALSGMDGVTILKFNSIDKRLKFGKEFAEYIVDFEKLTAEQLSRYVIKILGCSQERAVELAVYCGRDYLRCLLECDKIKRYGKICGIKNADDAFDAAVGDRVVVPDISSDIFEFVDMVVTRDKRCLDLYPVLRQRGEAGVPTISLIFRSFKNILVAQTDPGGKGVTERTGLAPFIYHKAKEQSGKFSSRSIERILDFLKQVEQGVKAGKIDEEVAVPFVMANLL